MAGASIEVGPGQALCIPRGAVHRFDNLGSEDVKQLAVISPAIMGPAYFREAAEVIGAAAGESAASQYRVGRVCFLNMTAFSFSLGA